jgi:hypothetical protein
VNAELAGYSLDRAYSELVFASNLLKQLHVRTSPAHRPPSRAPDTQRVADLVIAGGPLGIIEVGHTRVSKTHVALAQHVAAEEQDFRAWYARYQAGEGTHPETLAEEARRRGISELECLYN